MLAAAGLAMLLLAACSGQRVPAERMMSEIQTALLGASADAEKYVPGRLTDVQAKFDELKTDYDAQDYREILAHGPSILSEAQGLEGAASAKKRQLADALNSQWRALADSVPEEEGAVQRRIDRLVERKNRELAKDVDLGAAKSALADAGSQWSKAQGAFGNGNLDEAVSAGKHAQSRLEAAASGLKMELPGVPAASPPSS